MSAGECYYFDTSALLPYYRQEKTSADVEKLLCSLCPPIVISDLTRVEFLSAIARWVRMAEISEPQANLLENTFNADGKTGLYLRKSLGRTCYMQAEKWLSVRKTSMHTLDALHLACCLTSQAKMVTCDIVLHQSAELFGISSMLIS